ncbi:helix-turn-helix domain-containing protein [Yoonia sp. R2331]|uniref:helix-turn-helix domain-containing protein n=1 Tax=Yoonia sp. R2331 TaxID=3237238 RepID=UPI0034E61BB6
MSTVPTSWLISILAVFIAAAVVSRPRLPVAARLLFGLALSLVAVVTVFVGLRSVYGIEALSPIQPHIAILIAPTLWLGFQSLASTTGSPTGQNLVITAFGLIAGQLALLLQTAWSADLVVIGTNAICAILLARMLFQSPEVFVQVAPNKYRMTRVALLFALLFIALIVAADLIFVAVLSAGNTGIIQLLTGVSGVVVTVILLSALIGVPLVLGGQTRQASCDPAADTPLEEDQDLLRKLDQLMAEQQMFTDPDLTLARLGRRIHCPARSVSKAVNRIHGENISRYINGFRVRHAAMLLTTTDLPVTDIMLEAGFQSKSSFNTEFRRLTGQTPSDYKRQESGNYHVRNRDFKRSET